MDPGHWSYGTVLSWEQKNGDNISSAVVDEVSLCFGVACTVLCPPILITVYSLVVNKLATYFLMSLLGT